MPEPIKATSPRGTLVIKPEDRDGYLALLKANAQLQEELQNKEKQTNPLPAASVPAKPAAAAAPPRVWTEGAVLALTSATLGREAVRDLNVSTLNPGETRKRCAMLLGLSGIKVQGLEAELSRWNSKVELTQVQRDCLAARQARADAFAAKPEMTTGRLLDLADFVFGKTIQENLRYAKTDLEKREALVRRLNACQIHVSDVPELATNPHKKTLLQKRVDEFIAQ